MIIIFIVAFVVVRSRVSITNDPERAVSAEPEFSEIDGTIQAGETLFDIFKDYGLDIRDLDKLKKASTDIYRLRELHPDHPYKIVVDKNNQVNSFIYWINDDTMLHISRTGSEYQAEKKAMQYEKRIEHRGGIIQDNLISSMGEGKENLMLALQLSDILAWDIDFTTDIRDGDIFKIVVEGLYLNGVFKKYGDILSAEFVNHSETYHVYRFEQNREAGYYDDEGKILKRAFLKTPLSFRRISSTFSKNRLHPVLKIYRPHHGLDYEAAAGTPVSSVGSGTVIFSGNEGQYGKLIIVKHPNGWKTYYGHLSRIAKRIGKGVRVEQGQMIGYVGDTGLATGPHLHYEIRINNKPVNPLTLKLPRGKSIPNALMADFMKFKREMDARLASTTPPDFAAAKSRI